MGEESGREGLSNRKHALWSIYMQLKNEQFSLGLLTMTASLKTIVEKRTANDEA